MQNSPHEITPPEFSATNDGTSDADLLRAISDNPDCAHVLAAIAAGGDARELIATLLPPEVPPQPDDTPPDDTVTAPVSEAPSAPEVAMYQTPGLQQPPTAEDSCPAFLAHVSPDFWDSF